MNKNDGVLASAQPRKPKPKAKLSKQAYESLLEELATWRLQPGEIIVEADVARRLGVSRTPVREALRALVAEGFLKVIPRAGYMVVPVTPDDVREIYHMRLLLEGEAAALAAERIEEGGVQGIIQELASRLKEMERHSSENGESSKPTPEQNTHFHLAIARASGNRRLRDAIDRVLQGDRRVVYYPSSADLRLFAQVHLALLDEIRSGDPERARAAMRQHIEESRSGLVRWFGST